MTDQDMPQTYLTPAETAKLLRCTTVTLYRMLKRDQTFPRGITLSRAKTLWKREEIEAWVDAQARQRVELCAGAGGIA